MSTLLQSQKNQILLAIQKAGLDAREFSWVHQTLTPSRRVVDVLRHRTGFYFRFDVMPGARISTYTPGENTVSDSETSSTWDNQFFAAVRWLGYLKREIDQPDLWRELTKTLVIPPPGPDGDERAFSQMEKAQLKLALAEVLEHVKATQSLNTQQLARLTRQLDDLADAANRITVKDWKMLVIGALMSLAFTATIAPEAVKQSLGIIARVVFPGLQQLTALP